MSGLIKAGTGHSARPFFPASGDAEDGRRRETDEPAEDPRLGRLRREVEALSTSLAHSAVELKRATAEAKEAGKREMLESIQRNEASQRQTIDKAIAKALQAWESRLAELDGLAALVSKTALSKLFDDDASRSELIQECIARQMRHLRRETVVAVRVSPEDFTDGAALQALAAREAAGPVKVIADPELESGDCRLDLQLGHVDIGPRTQWAELVALLDKFLAEDPRA